MGPSESTSPSKSLAKEAPKPRPKQKLKRKQLLGLSEKPAPVKASGDDMKKGGQKNQMVASSGVATAQVALPGVGVERRRGTYFDAGEPNGVTRKGDGISDSQGESRVISGTGVDRGRRRSSIG